MRHGRVVALVCICGCADRPLPPEHTPDPPATPTAAQLIAIVPSKSRIDVGEALQLGVVATDAQQRIVAAPPVQWSTSSPEVATVTAAGTVRGIAPGYVRIGAASSSLAAHVMLHVQRDGVYPDIVIIEPATSSIGDCGSLQLQARTLPDVGSPRFSWRSSDSVVARVDATGRVTAARDGAASVTALWQPDTSRRAVRELRVTGC